MRIYVASSWKNDYQSVVVSALREDGHKVYDFKNPMPGNHGFHWSSIDPYWKSWSVSQYQKALKHKFAKDGFKLDFKAMRWANAFVLVLPCGKSAHLELGWAVGAGKKTAILLDGIVEPELMYKLVDHVCDDLVDLSAVMERRG